MKAEVGGGSQRRRPHKVIEDAKNKISSKLKAFRNLAKKRRNKLFLYGLDLVAKLNARKWQAD
jgi:hypothetical protein